MFLWLESTFSENVLLPSNAFTKAANYAIEHRDELKVFLSNPEVSLDTSHLEREIRPIALGRKNWMFCWSEIGAEYAAIAYSIIGSCKLHGINPYHYLVDVLQRVQKHPASDVQSLIPRIWKDKFQDEKMISVVDVKKSPVQI